MGFAVMDIGWLCCEYVVNGFRRLGCRLFGNPTFCAVNCWVNGRAVNPTYGDKRFCYGYLVNGFRRLGCRFFGNPTFCAVILLG